MLEIYFIEQFLKENKCCSYKVDNAEDKKKAEELVEKNNGNFILSNSDIHHIKKVMRCKNNDKNCEVMRACVIFHVRRCDILCRLCSRVPSIPDIPQYP